MSGVVLSLSLVVHATAAQEPTRPITPANLEEAIQLATDEKTARKFLDAYVLQPRAGWGHGPLIGTFSTPFSRVVQAALTARKKGHAFTMNDVAADLVVPELHVIATPQPAASDESAVAGVLSIVIAPRGAKNATELVEPLNRMELSEQYQALHGIEIKGPATVAVFPLSAVVPNSEIRVMFDRVARGVWGASACRECIVPFDTTRVR